MSSTAVAPVPVTPKKMSEIQVINKELSSVSGQIAKALPEKTISVDHLIRSALTCCSKNPKLLQSDPRSIMACVVQVAELGLELAGPLGQAYLVPYWNSRKNCNEATLQIGYKGFLELGYRSDKVHGFNAHVVYGGDEFDYSYGTNQYIIHKPSNDNVDFTDDNITHAYAVMTLDRGHREFTVMSKAQIQAHMERYVKKDKNGKFSDAWVGSFPAMAMKTCLRKLAKFSPLSLLQAAAALDEYAEAGVQQGILTNTPTLEQTTQGKLASLKGRLTGQQEEQEEMGMDIPDSDTPESDPLQADSI